MLYLGDNPNYIIDIYAKDLVEHGRKRAALVWLLGEWRCYKGATLYTLFNGIITEPPQPSMVKQLSHRSYR